MLRKVIRPNQLDEKTTLQLLKTYPSGYGDRDVISFRNHKGKKVQAVELKTTDTVYLIKTNNDLGENLGGFIRKTKLQLEIARNAQRP